MTRHTAYAISPVIDALAQCIDQGVLMVADDVVVAVNRGFLRLFDPRAEQADLVGQPVSALAARESFRQAAALWAARTGGYGRRLRCPLPDGRVIEGRWRQLPSDGPPLLVAVLGDYTAEAGARRRMRRHNRALAELVATKTELVSALLHELRTPLTAALAMADLLPDRTGDPTLDEALPLITRKLRRIDEVTAEIATISGIENGRVPLDRSEFDLPDLLAEVAASTGVAVVAHPAPAAVTGDRTWLGRVFRRLVAAVRAVGPDGDRMTAELIGDRWRIALRLPEQHSTDRLFTAGDGGGNATALMLARAVIGRHGGRVGVESLDGTPCLVIRLPAG